MDAKRLIDCIASLAGLLLLGPMLLGLGLAVALSSGFPILFKQQRVGRNGRDFVLYKFRTMAVLRGSEKGTFDAGNNSRVTWIGGLLRKSKLDELPQLWNVVRGDMALVGPRPEIRKWVDVYPDRWAFVHSVRPGITDPASIVFRNEEEILALAPEPERAYRDQILPHKLALYEEYVRSQSLWGDLQILARTFRAVLGGTRPKMVDVPPRTT